MSVVFGTQVLSIATGPARCDRFLSMKATINANKAVPGRLETSRKPQAAVSSLAAMASSARLANIKSDGDVCFCLLRMMRPGGG